MNTLAAGGSSPVDTIVMIIIMVALVAGYWLPTIAAWVNHAPNRGSVVVVNLFLGWTVIGWIVAMAMAFRDPRRDIR